MVINLTRPVRLVHVLLVDLSNQASTIFLVISIILFLSVLHTSDGLHV